jgi:hypothetical protein
MFQNKISLDTRLSKQDRQGKYWLAAIDRTQTLVRLLELWIGEIPNSAQMLKASCVANTLELFSVLGIHCVSK